MNAELVKRIIAKCEDIGKEVDSVKQKKEEILGEYSNAGAVE